MIGSNVTSTTTKRQLLLFLFFLPFVSFFIFSVNLRLARLRSHVLHCMLTDQHMPAPPSLFCSVVAWNDKSKAEMNRYVLALGSVLAHFFSNH